MEAIRIIQKPIEGKITITLPASFSDEEVEIIILLFERTAEKKSKFDPEKYRGFMKNIDMDTPEQSRSHALRGNADRTLCVRSGTISFPRSAWECSSDALRPFRNNLVPTLCVGMQTGRSASFLIYKKIKGAGQRWGEAAIKL